MNIRTSFFLIVLFTIDNGLSAQYVKNTVSLNSADGLKINADYYPANIKNATLLILLHQSGSSRGEYTTIASRLQVLGYNCLAVDLRWGRKDPWNHVDNETSRYSGAYEVIENYQNTSEYRKTKVWPLMLESYQDMEAALKWSNTNHPESKIVVWGSSFSAMLQFKLGAEHPEEIDGMVSYSPGEYHETDTLMLSRWTPKINHPIFIGSGKSNEELTMTQAVFNQLSSPLNVHYQSTKGTHGSSILIDDEENWQPLLTFLSQFNTQKGPMTHLSYAAEAAEWIHSLANNGKWPDATDDYQKISNSFSDGVAGKVVFFLELYHATNQDKYLTWAKNGGKYLLDHLPQKADSLQGKFWAFSPYGNVCGAGFALTELFKVTKEDKYRNGAISIFEVVKHFANRSEDSISWDTGNDVLGGLSGTGLYLLYVNKELHLPEAQLMAIKAGHTLISRAIQTDSTLNWKRGQSSKFILPNFSHGAAGVGYFLARLYEDTQERSFLEAALKAEAYLDSIAKKNEDVFLLPYGFPDPGWSRPYDIGWAHGPAGVARFYHQLNKVSPNSKWKNRIKQCQKAIEYSNVPFQPNTDFGEEFLGIDQRFGLAGVTEFLIEEHRLSKSLSTYNQAQLLLNHILNQSTINIDGRRFWTQKRFGFMPNAGEETAFTGYFYGAAGYGLMLLNMHYLNNENEPRIRFVDNPY